MNRTEDHTDIKKNIIFPSDGLMLVVYLFVVIIQLYRDGPGDIGSTAVLVWHLVTNIHITTCFMKFYKSGHYIVSQITPTNDDSVFPSQRAEGRCYTCVWQH